MEVFSLSGVGDRPTIAIDSPSLDDLESLRFMNPDDVIDPPADARRHAVARWVGWTFVARPDHDKRFRPAFQDAIGPGLVVPGCNLAVSDRAKEALTSVLQDQVVFLPIKVDGAPVGYWLFYATEYYGELDDELTIYAPPYRSALDQRKLIRQPAFLDTERLHQLFVFRVPGTASRRSIDQTFATSAFLDVIKKSGLSGFTFGKILHEGRNLGTEESITYVSTGLSYEPLWKTGRY